MRSLLIAVISLSISILVACSPTILDNEGDISRDERSQSITLTSRTNLWEYGSHLERSDSFNELYSSLIRCKGHEFSKMVETRVFKLIPKFTTPDCLQLLVREMKRARMQVPRGDVSLVISGTIRSLRYFALLLRLVQPEYLYISADAFFSVYQESQTYFSDIKHVYLDIAPTYRFISEHSIVIYDFEQSQFVPASVRNNFIQVLPDLFPKLKSLSCNADLIHYNNGNYFNRFKSLEILKLRQESSEAKSSFGTWEINAFPNLQHLYIHGQYWETMKIFKSDLKMLNELPLEYSLKDIEFIQVPLVRTFRHVKYTKPESIWKSNTDDTCIKCTNSNQSLTELIIYGSTSTDIRSNSENLVSFMNSLGSNLKIVKIKYANADINVLKSILKNNQKIEYINLSDNSIDLSSYFDATDGTPRMEVIHAAIAKLMVETKNSGKFLQYMNLERNPLSFNYRDGAFIFYNAALAFDT
jgi:hypothetical protein